MFFFALHERYFCLSWRLPSSPFFFPVRAFFLISFLSVAVFLFPFASWASPFFFHEGDLVFHFLPHRVLVVCFRD